MKIHIDTGACISCGLCVHICPDVFALESEAACVVPDEIPSRIEEECRMAAGDCPAEAIIIEDEEEKVEEGHRWRLK